jgi:hypothetical protein
MFSLHIIDVVSTLPPGEIPSISGETKLFEKAKCMELGLDPTLAMAK